MLRILHQVFVSSLKLGALRCTDGKLVKIEKDRLEEPANHVIRLDDAIATADQPGGGGIGQAEFAAIDHSRVDLTAAGARAEDGGTRIGSERFLGAAGKQEHSADKNEGYLF